MTDLFLFTTSQLKIEPEKKLRILRLCVQCKKEICNWGEESLGKENISGVQEKQGLGFGSEDDAVLSVCVCVFLLAHTGQSYGCGGRSCPTGDHSQHASLCGLSVRQPIGAPASDGVCTDGRHWTGLETITQSIHAHTNSHLQKQGRGG